MRNQTPLYRCSPRRVAVMLTARSRERRLAAGPARERARDDCARLRLRLVRRSYRKCVLAGLARSGDRLAWARWGSQSRAQSGCTSKACISEWVMALRSLLRS